MELKTTKLSAFDGMELKEATFRKQTFPAHFHDSYSIGIIEKGIERLSYGEKDVLAHAHTVTIINPYEIHANSYFDNDRWKYRAIYLSTDLMRHLQQKTGFHKYRTVWFASQAIIDSELYSNILKFHYAPSYKLLYSICICLLSRYAITRPEAEYKPANNITDATRFLVTHLPHKINIEDLATRYAMDKFSFIRAFKKQTGLTPNNYLLLHRINKAKTLIAQSMSIGRIALETGFYDQSHFNHYFRKYIGISPLAYRKNLIVA